MNIEVDEFIDQLDQWKAEMVLLRAILLECGLEEEWKWRQPCYCYNRRNVVLLHCFNDYCGLGFFKGALLSNEHSLLQQQGENSIGSRVMKFTTTGQIVENKNHIKATLFEAIEIERAGLKVDYSANKEFDLVPELTARFEHDSHFKEAFEALTIGRQRAYNLYFSSAKQSKTVETRIDKYTDRILDGKGINDCVCGHSKKMPNCDGSHKYF